MKAGWQTKKLGELCRIRTGKKDVNQGNSKGEYPFFTCAAEHTYSDTFSFDTEALLIAGNGDVGKVSYYNGKFEAYQRTYVVSDFKDVQSRFLYLILDGKLKDTVSQQKLGNTMPYIKVGMLTDFLVPIPPLPEQQRIVGILDAAFDGIATAKATAEQNLQNARALFESHLQSVFTQRGEGWIEKKLSDVCAITSTLVDPRKGEFLDLTHVGAGNIESQTGVFIDLKTAREEGLISGKFLFDETMVLYSKIRPYLMKVARPNFNGLCSADMYPLAPLPNEITRDYLFHLLLSKPFTDYAIQGSARAGMPKVNREHLFEFSVWLPNVKKQTELAAKLDALHEETQRLESLYQRKLAALDELKKSLLHQAFSGAL